MGLLFPFIFSRHAVQHGIHGHVGRVEARRALRNVPVPSDPFANPGDNYPSLLPSRRPPHGCARGRS